MMQFYFDCGTSNTRGYLISDSDVISTIKLNIGSKDVSIQNDRMILVEGMKRIYDTALDNAGVTNDAVESIYASGMVTSPFGLAEIPHGIVPADKHKMKEWLVPHYEATLFHRDIILMRGLKTASPELSLANIDQINNLRGEETEIAGICNHIPEIWKSSRYVILLPGSHTHAVLMDNETIIDIFSMFSGEIFHALTASTILASSTTTHRDSETSVYSEATKNGFENVRNHGFARAVYIVHAMKLFGIGDNMFRRQCLSGVVHGAAVQSLIKHMADNWSEVKNIAIYADTGMLSLYIEAIRCFSSTNGIDLLLIDRNVANCSVEGLLNIIGS